MNIDVKVTVILAVYYSILLKLNKEFELTVQMLWFN